MHFYRKTLIVFVIAAMAVATVFADTATLLVLYTNDIHDYIKPGPNNAGGMPYLAAYVAARRAERGDVLLLDGGDVMEKGDMVAFKAESRITYKAMRKMGYDAGAVGNHDLVHGIEHLRECATLADMAVVCVNHFDEEGTLAFPPSTVVEVNGVRVGIIGLTRIRGSLEEDGARLAAEAARLEDDVHLLAVVAHIGSRECAQMSALAPQVDLFIGGHTHEVLQNPVVVPDTGALIVQAGQYAQYMGHLEIVVDLNEKRIVHHENKMALMCHDTVEPDAEMLAWILEEEKRHCPEASEIVGKADAFLSAIDMGRLAAAALRHHGKADVGFCHAGQVMRSGVFPGAVDVNALFRTGGQRGRDLLVFELTGAQIEAYLAGLVQERRGRSEWDGFRAGLVHDSETNQWTMESDLDAEKTYRVIMSEREWEQRFLRVINRHPLFTDFAKDSAQSAAFTFTQALKTYVRHITEQGETLNAHAAALLEARTL